MQDITASVTKGNYRQNKAFNTTGGFILQDGHITGYGIISDLYQIDDPEICDITGRPWGKRGDWAVNYNDWHWLNKSKPVPFKGF